jgi:hypothetical protein
MKCVAFRFSRKGPASERYGGWDMSTRRRRLFSLVAVLCCAGAGTLFGSTFAHGGTAVPPVSVLANPPETPPADSASVQNLANAVTGWNSQSTDPAHATGAPLTSDARDLMTDVGAAGDTLGAFPTANGGVCYEILAAGGCGNLNAGPWSNLGFTFSILFTQGGGTRVFGVVSDSVAKIDVETGGVDYPATVSGNGFYYQLPYGVSGDQVQQITATWKDGSVHTFSLQG